jgi:hypothetical protein
MITPIAVVPALIDQPIWSDDLAEWIRYRADLQALADLPGIEEFFDEADAVIARLAGPNRDGTR